MCVYVCSAKKENKVMTERKSATHADIQVLIHTYDIQIKEGEYSDLMRLKERELLDQKQKLDNEKKKEMERMLEEHIQETEELQVSLLYIDVCVSVCLCVTDNEKQKRERTVANHIQKTETLQVSLLCIYVCMYVCAYVCVCVCLYECVWKTEKKK
jgi:hypothetical protein